MKSPTLPLTFGTSRAMPVCVHPSDPPSFILPKIPQEREDSVLARARKGPIKATLPA